MSISDIELDSLSDKDELSGDFNEVFNSPYYCAHSVNLGNSYVLNVDVNCDNSKYLAAFSNKQVKIFSPSLDVLTTVNPHENTVTQCSFSKTDSNLFFTSSSDCTIRLWDLRSPAKSSLEFRDTTDPGKHQGPPSRSTKPITCFDTSADSRLVCGGTEQVGQDSYILFWDVRSGSLMGGYWESHDDDITCIRFHPKNNDSMASGSTDGLVNVFDLKEAKEDDALISCHNTEDSVSSLHWFSKKENDRYLAIATHTEGLQLWDTDHYQPYQTFNRSDIAHGIRRSTPEHVYIVGAHDQEDQGFLLMAGSRYSADPCLRLATMKNKKLKPVADLSAGKTTSSEGIVRDSAQLKQFSGFITGSEGGVVKVWRPGTKPEAQADTSLKMKNKTSKRDKPY